MGQPHSHCLSFLGLLSARGSQLFLPSGCKSSTGGANWMGREVSFMHRKDRRWCSNQGKKNVQCSSHNHLLAFPLPCDRGLHIFPNKQRMGKEQDGAVICMALLSRGCRAELCAGRAVTARCSLHLGETLFCLDGKKKIRQERANQKCWHFFVC